MADELEKIEDGQIPISPEMIEQGIGLVVNFLNSAEKKQEKQFELNQQNIDLQAKHLEFEQEKFRSQNKNTSLMFKVMCTALLAILGAGVVLLFVPDGREDGMGIIAVIGSLLIGLIGGMFMKSPNQD